MQTASPSNERRHLKYRRRFSRAAGTVAILSALDDQAVTKAIDENLKRDEAFARFDRNHYLDLVAATRQQGFVETEGIVSGEIGFGVVVRGIGGEMLGGLSLAVMKDRLDEEHRVVALKTLKEQAEYIHRTLNTVDFESVHRRVA